MHARLNPKPPQCLLQLSLERELGGFTDRSTGLVFADFVFQQAAFMSLFGVGVNSALQCVGVGVNSGLFRGEGLQLDRVRVSSRVEARLIFASRGKGYTWL